MEHIGKGKDLGIMVNSKLSASDQVTEARKKALRMLGVINRNYVYKSAEVITDNQTLLRVCQTAFRILCSSLVSYL